MGYIYRIKDGIIPKDGTQKDFFFEGIDFTPYVLIKTEGAFEEGGPNVSPKAFQFRMKELRKAIDNGVFQSAIKKLVY